MLHRLSIAASLLTAIALVAGMRAVGSSEGLRPGGSPPVLRTGDVPVGSLGSPLGSYLTVQGVRLDGPKSGVSTLQVDTVNGRRLTEPVSIWTENLDLPKGQRCELKGYETARMIGVPPAKAAADAEQGKASPAPQAGWQVQLTFVVLRAVQPRNLQFRAHP